MEVCPRQPAQNLHFGHFQLAPWWLQERLEAKTEKEDEVEQIFTQLFKQQTTVSGDSY